MLKKILKVFAALFTLTAIVLGATIYYVKFTDRGRQELARALDNAYEKAGPAVIEGGTSKQSESASRGGKLFQYYANYYQGLEARYQRHLPAPDKLAATAEFSWEVLPTGAKVFRLTAENNKLQFLIESRQDYGREQLIREDHGSFDIVSSGDLKVESDIAIIEADARFTKLLYSYKCSEKSGRSLEAAVAQTLDMEKKGDDTAHRAGLVVFKDGREYSRHPKAPIKFEASVASLLNPTDPIEGLLKRCVERNEQPQRQPASAQDPIARELREMPQ